MELELQLLSDQDHSEQRDKGESDELRNLQVWLQNFIRKEGIVIDKADESISLNPETPNKPMDRVLHESSSFRKIHVVPDRLKKPRKGEEDCFTPQSFPIGLHRLVSCFRSSPFEFKFDIARAFIKKVIIPKPAQNSEGWKSLVSKIVGSPAEAHELVTDAYKDFRTWELKVEPDSSTSQTIRDWHFALILAVDAVFVVTSLQASIHHQKNYSEEINDLIGNRMFEIAEFLNRDLSLVENQVPLKLLWRVIDLQVNSKTEPEGQGQTGPADQPQKQRTTAKEFEELIKQAVRLSYPFSSSDPERDNCWKEFTGCCCSCCFHDSEDDGSQSDPEVGGTSGIDVDCFDSNWKQTYEDKLRPENCSDLLNCIHVVSSWLKPPFDAVPPSNGREKPKRNKVNNWKGDWIPSATALRDAGVRIRGVATCLASSSFETINLCTVLCCFVTFLCCCFDSTCSSSTKRLRASLELPRVKMYTETKRLLRNLAVYEELTHGETISHLRNYIKTMRCLVPKEEDVLLLIRSGVIQSHLAGPQDVVETWRDVDDGLAAVALGGRWVKIYADVHKHVKNRWKNWYARFWISNCSNPMVACSFVIFIVLFLLSAFGTYLNVGNFQNHKGC